MTTKGKCEICSSEVIKAKAKEHVFKCTKGDIRRSDSNRNALYTRVASGINYWLDICVGKSAKLSDLDHFLKGIWVEDGCGHLSQFEIGSRRFVYGVDDPEFDLDFDGESMSIPVRDVLRPSDSAVYEYDFGSTTTLSINVLADIEDVDDEKVGLLIRNVPPYPKEVNSPRAGVCGYPLLERRR